MDDLSDDDDHKNANKIKHYSNQWKNDHDHSYHDEDGDENFSNDDNDDNDDDYNDGDDDKDEDNNKDNEYIANHLLHCFLAAYK